MILYLIASNSDACFCGGKRSKLEIWGFDENTNKCSSIWKGWIRRCHALVWSGWQSTHRRRTMRFQNQSLTRQGITHNIVSTCTTPYYRWYVHRLNNSYNEFNWCMDWLWRCINMKVCIDSLTVYLFSLSTWNVIWGFNF